MTVCSVFSTVTCAVTIAASVAGGKPTGATGAARSRLSNSAGLFRGSAARSVSLGRRAG
jgi:hypothetical protein